MKEIERKVVKILETNKRARGDDAVLYCALMKRYYKMDLDAYSAEWFILNCRELGLPSIESIGRFRRHAQEMDERLKPTEDIQLQRRKRENSFYCYIKGIDKNRKV